ncbi:hypothetical protein wTpre_1285 [Wolbachia endosymbiont of Trichogramma pretiosum]|nr:hypothetical protein wTpre_1285 [Wolbachia endosymbiont of Trichogramma pretiosum]
MMLTKIIVKAALFGDLFLMNIGIMERLKKHTISGKRKKIPQIYYIKSHMIA